MKQKYLESLQMNTWTEIRSENLEIKIWSENSISIPVHPGIIYFWIWLFGGAAYQREKEAKAERGSHQWATFVWKATIDRMWRSLQYLTVVI